MAAPTPTEAVQCFGRKKTAVVVTHCKRGRGLIRINGVPIELVQPEALHFKACEPVLLLDRHRFADIEMCVRVSGGGQTSPIYAIWQSIAKALVAFFQKYRDEQSKKEIKDILIRYDRTRLVADPRRCEKLRERGNLVLFDNRNRILWQSFDYPTDTLLPGQCYGFQVCGLKWSYDNRELASGGNDNRLFIWNQHSTQPLHKYCEHTAAVKAIAWSPHLHGLLTSGGGTADRCIQFWNTRTNSHLNCIDTGSQVPTHHYCITDFRKTSRPATIVGFLISEVNVLPFLVPVVHLLLPSCGWNWMGT